MLKISILICSLFACYQYQWPQSDTWHVLVYQSWKLRLPLPSSLIFVLAPLSLTVSHISLLHPLDLSLPILSLSHISSLHPLHFSLPFISLSYFFTPSSPFLSSLSLSLTHISSLHLSLPIHYLSPLLFLFPISPPLSYFFTQSSQSFYSLSLSFIFVLSLPYLTSLFLSLTSLFPISPLSLIFLHAI